MIPSSASSRCFTCMCWSEFRRKSETDSLYNSRVLYIELSALQFSALRTLAILVSQASQLHSVRSLTGYAWVLCDFSTTWKTFSSSKLMEPNTALLSGVTIFCYLMSNALKIIVSHIFFLFLSSFPAGGLLTLAWNRNLKFVLRTMSFEYEIWILEDQIHKKFWTYTLRYNLKFIH